MTWRRNTDQNIALNFKTKVQFKVTAQTFRPAKPDDDNHSILCYRISDRGAYA